MIFQNSCSTCVNYISQGRCLAFPDGIISEIWEGRNNHTEAVDGDRGVRFEDVSGDVEESNPLYRSNSGKSAT